MRKKEKMRRKLQIEDNFITSLTRKNKRLKTKNRKKMENQTKQKIV